MRLTLPAGTRRVYRWATGMTAQGNEHPPERFNGCSSEETVGATATMFVSMTNLPVGREAVVEIATKMGPGCWVMVAGFYLQKDSDLNLEHGYTTDSERIHVYDDLLQIAHQITQLLEKGSVLRHLAKPDDKTPLAH